MRACITKTYVDDALVETLINGKSLDDIGPSDLLYYIGNTESAIKKLADYDSNKCKFIVQETKRLSKFVDSLYVILDSKFLESKYQ